MNKAGAVLFFLWMVLWVPSEGLSLSQPHREVRLVMGTLLDITLYSESDQVARNAFDETFFLAQRLDAILSNYKPTSEVSRLNSRAGTGPFRVSRELHRLLSLSRDLTSRTGGAFDITVGPMVKLWKEAASSGVPPSAEAIEKARRLVGGDRLVIHSDSRVELKPAGAQVDTGGIGKGYAVDRIADLLAARGITRALINFGHSSIYAMGSPPEKSVWQLLLRFPVGEPLGILELKDQALSASEVLGRSFRIGDHTYGHLIDPSTGIPLARGLRAVALAPSAAKAEALTKYLLLRGWNEKVAASWSDVEVLRLEGRKVLQRSKGLPLRLFSLDQADGRGNDSVHARNNRLH